MDLNELIVKLVEIQENTIGKFEVEYLDHDGYLNSINKVFLNKDGVIVLTAGD